MMQAADILKEFDEKNQPAKINKTALFIVHVSAIICLGFAGQFLSLILFSRSFDSFQYQLAHPPAEDAAIIDDIALLPLVNKILSIGFVIVGGIVSYSQCRKYKLRSIIPISILLYGFLLWWTLSSNSVMENTGYFFPGTFFLRVLQINIGQIVNFVFFFAIASFLFFTKIARRWWNRSGNNQAV